jgi:CSLREA domain-containing protein
VTTTPDELTNNAKCSLREAVRAANLHKAVDTCPAGIGNDAIIVPAATYPLTIQGAGENATLRGDLASQTPSAVVQVTRGRPSTSRRSRTGRPS